MKGNPFRGFGYLIRGFGLLTEPGLRSFVIVPLAINLVLFTLAIYLLMQQFSVLVEYCLSLMPDWLSFLDWFMWPVFAILVLISVYFSFSIVANFIAAPFNGLLAERVEQRLRGEILVDDGWKALLASVPRALHREMSKLLYQLPRFLILLLITLIPVIGFIAPALWFLFGAWMMAIQYCDYPMDNNRVSFSDLRSNLKTRRLSSLGFGGLVSLGMVIPVLNLLIMPAAVIGATIFWVEEFAPESSAQIIEQT
ncbi:sulfate transporter CysZ [Motiliproteus sp. MSK22-1]|uniref:sulfate transporter CysZ n=1 Tax=Motiliproteus sp. MSK22-1 TaxID=1897630 RepID=UPI0009774487|nr:sulfate transporter CysZ [Motiliproteus sp. MSK22-1]OMH28133.1 sulfate transporter CysZ [Motiliproteus sp. MSK22-1]